MRRNVSLPAECPLWVISGHVGVREKASALPRSMRQTDQQYPSVSSQTKGLQVNTDGSVDVYFGPKTPPGEANNWVQTIPGKAWFTLLRLYGPLEPWFDKSWRPGDIEEVK